MERVFFLFYIPPILFTPNIVKGLGTWACLSTSVLELSTITLRYLSFGSSSAG